MNQTQIKKKTRVQKQDINKLIQLHTCECGLKCVISRNSQCFSFLIIECIKCIASVYLLDCKFNCHWCLALDTSVSNQAITVERKCIIANAEWDKNVWSWQNCQGVQTEQYFRDILLQYIIPSVQYLMW